MVSLIKQNSYVLLVFEVVSFLSTSEIWLHKKFPSKEEMILVAAGTPVTDCSFLKLGKFKIQQVLQGNNFKHIVFNPFAAFVAFHIETSQLTYSDNRMIRFH